MALSHTPHRLAPVLQVNRLSAPPPPTFEGFGDDDDDDSDEWLDDAFDDDRNDKPVVPRRRPASSGGSSQQDVLKRTSIVGDKVLLSLQSQGGSNDVAHDSDSDDPTHTWV